MSEYEALSVEHDGHVATVTLLGPGKGNAMGPDFWREVPQAFDALDAADEVRAVVVRGSGANFSYGLDLPAVSGQFMGMLQDRSVTARMQLHEMVLEWQRAFDAIEQCRKPVIAAIHGWCIGGGMNMIAACDMRVASAQAQFSLREVKLAITPDLGALQRLPGIIGEGMTRRLAMTGEDVGADVALRCGLVEQLFESDEACLQGAHDLARQIAGNSPLVVQGIKRVLNEGLDHQRAQGQRYVAAWNAAFLPSEDLVEAFMAFMQKREPSFQGK